MFTTWFESITFAAVRFMTLNIFSKFCFARVSVGLLSLQSNWHAVSHVGLLVWGKICYILPSGGCKLWRGQLIVNINYTTTNCLMNWFLRREIKIQAQGCCRHFSKDCGRCVQIITLPFSACKKIIININIIINLCRYLYQ